jgi:hypothetical protein
MKVIRHTGWHVADFRCWSRNSKSGGEIEFAGVVQKRILFQVQMKGNIRENRAKRLVARNEGMVGTEMIFRFVSTKIIQNVLSRPYIFRIIATHDSHSVFLAVFLTVACSPICRANLELGTSGGVEIYATIATLCDIRNYVRVE